MMASGTYSTGAATVTAGGATVALIGAIVDGINFSKYDVIEIGDAAALIVGVNMDDAELTITPWPGSSQTAQPYINYQSSSLRYDDVALAEDLRSQTAALNASWYEVFVASTLTAPDPSYGSNGQYAYQPSTGKRWRKEAGLWTYLGTSDPAFSRYDIAIDVPGRPGSGATLGKWVAPSLVTFRAGLSESVADADAAATAETVFSLRKNGVEFATITFAASDATATFVCATDTDFTSGDVLTLVAPTRDDTLSDIAFTIVGFR